MSGDTIIEAGYPEILDAHSCRNLHGDDDTLRPLSGEVKRLIEQLSAGRPLAALSSSISINLSEPRAGRCTSRAKRRAWHRKASYQRGRCRERLRPWQVDSLFEADSFARTIGLPLNAFLTGSWTNTTRGAADVRQRFARVTKSMGEWLKRHGVAPAWIFVHENPGGLRPNVHMLIHVPASLFAHFQEFAPRWFDALESGFQVRKRKGQRDKCLQYMCKGTDYATALRVGVKVRNQGPIEFKRCGWTENLGATARTRLTKLTTGIR